MSENIDEDKKRDEKIYGGIEGPNSQYVKLISSDGHEFIVKRDHALTSGTIKAMLSGPGQFSEHENNEINFREIPSHVLQKFNEISSVVFLELKKHGTTSELYVDIITL